MEKKPESIFINRELSWLDFDSRVLALAKEKTVPLGERIKALYATMQTAQVIATMPQTGAIADQIAKSAGFIDQDVAPIYPSDVQAMPLPECSPPAQRLSQAKNGCCHSIVRASVSGPLLLKSLKSIKKSYK